MEGGEGVGTGAGMVCVRRGQTDDTHNAHVRKERNLLLSSLHIHDAPVIVQDRARPIGSFVHMSNDIK